MAEQRRVNMRISKTTYNKLLHDKLKSLICLLKLVCACVLSIGNKIITNHNDLHDRQKLRHTIQLQVYRELVADNDKIRNNLELKSIIMLQSIENSNVVNRLGAEPRSTQVLSLSSSIQDVCRAI